MKSFHATKHHDVVFSLLRGRREALGIRQADLPQKLGQTQAMVSRVETGERRLDIVELRAWLSALEVSLLPFMKTHDLKLRNLPDDNLHLVRRSVAHRSHRKVRSTARAPGQSGRAESGIQPAL